MKLSNLNDLYPTVALARLYNCTCIGLSLREMLLGQSGGGLGTGLGLNLGSGIGQQQQGIPQVEIAKPVLAKLS